MLRFALASAALILTVAAAGAKAESVSGLHAKNTLVKFDLGNPVTVGTETYPQVSLSPATGDGRGSISFVTGNLAIPPFVSPNIASGYIEFIPAGFKDPQPRSGQPLCLFMGNLTPTFATGDYQYIWNVPAIQPFIGANYFQDANGAWHVGVTIIVQPKATPVPYELDYICLPK